MLFVITLIQIAILLLDVLTWVIIGQIILSWLVAFNVINTSSEGVRRFLAGLERFLAPLYRPIRKIMPDFGGLDLSPIVLLLAIKIVSDIILPNIAASLTGPGVA